MTTFTPITLPCPEPDIADPTQPCAAAFERAGLLAAHLNERHMVNASTALRVAREMATKDEAPPQIVLPDGCARTIAPVSVEVNIEEVKSVKACGYCKRFDGTHTERCHTLRRGESCKYCRRLGESCHWHGGVSHSNHGANKAVLRARKAGKPTNGAPIQRAVKANGSPLSAARVALLAEIAATKTRLAKLEAAHAGLVELGA